MVDPWARRALRGLPKQVGPTLFSWAVIAVVAVVGVSVTGGAMKGSPLGAIFSGGGSPLGSMPVVDNVTVPSDEAALRAVLPGGPGAPDPGPVALDLSLATCRVSGDVCRLTRGEVVVFGSCPEGDYSACDS